MRSETEFSERMFMHKSGVKLSKQGIFVWILRPFREKNDGFCAYSDIDIMDALDFVMS